MDVNAVNPLSKQKVRFSSTTLFQKRKEFTNCDDSTVHFAIGPSLLSAQKRVGTACSFAQVHALDTGGPSLFIFPAEVTWHVQKIHKQRAHLFNL